MPQLDIASFVTQVFWLIVIFFIFFLVSRKNILPFLCRILKLRSKKLSSSKNIVSLLLTENKKIYTKYNSFFSDTCIKIENLLSLKTNSLNSWVISESSQLKGNTNLYLRGLLRIFVTHCFIVKYSIKNK